MGNNLRKLRIEHRWKLRDMPGKTGISYGSYMKLERNERRLNESTISLMAKVFGVDPGALINDDNGVPIIGYINDDQTGTLIYVKPNEGDLKAPMPPGGNERTVAVVVIGASMRGLAKAGSWIYFDDEKSEMSEDFLGELCVVWLRDGTQIIRTPYPSATLGRFDLEGEGFPTLRGQDVEAVSLVQWIKPRRADRKDLPGAS